MSLPSEPDGPVPAAAGTEFSLRWRSSRHARRLLTLGLAALFIATVARRPEFAGLAAPALLLLAAGRSQQRPPRVSVQVRPSTQRAFEGELVAVDLVIEGQGGCSVRWMLHPGREMMVPEPAGGLAADGPRVRFVVSPQRWGRRQIGTVDVVLRDRWRLAEGHLSVVLPAVECYPAPAQQRTQVVLSRLPNRLGEHAARTPGEGIEFAGVREYVPGDRQRSINWAASTRRGRLQVNTFAAERSQDVVLLVDGTSDVGEPGSSAVDLALRGAAAAARAYLDARDRVGVITYHTGATGWLVPGLGRRQVYRIIDSMLASARGATGATSGSGSTYGVDLRRVPRAALPPGALIVVFSPLLDHRFVETLRDMRERGLMMLVVDVLNADPPARSRSTDRMAGRIWRMEQEAIRFSLHELGVPVVHWDGIQSLDLPLAGYTRRPLVASGDAAMTRTLAIRAAAILLGAGCVIWAAAPLVHKGLATLALILAIAGVAGGALRLLLAGIPVPADSFLLPAPVRLGLGFLETLRRVPWEEGAVVAVVWLEVVHSSRPWPTAVLGAALIAYLLATHLAESGASPVALRPQVRVLAIGAALLALGAGAGMLPATGPGAGSAVLRLLAAGALIVGAALVLPYVAPDE